MINIINEGNWFKFKDSLGSYQVQLVKEGLVQVWFQRANEHVFSRQVDNEIGRLITDSPSLKTVLRLVAEKTNGLIH